MIASSETRGSATGTRKAHHTRDDPLDDTEDERSWKGSARAAGTASSLPTGDRS